MNEYINVTVNISDDCIIIPKTQYNELIENQLKGVWWSVTDLENHLQGRKRQWIMENILLVPRFKKILDIENGGCVFYPGPDTGQKWSIEAVRMRKFLYEYFPEIYKEYNKGA